MAPVNKVYDVFLSHAAAETTLAREVAGACRVNGIEAFTDADLSPGADVSDAVWDALAECRALVLILSTSGLTSSMWVEIGAAQAWNKPIYAIVTDPAMSPPPALARIPLYPVGRREEIVRAIKGSTQQWSNENRSLLARLYSEIGVPVDELVVNPGSLTKLVKQFRTKSGASVSGEEVLSELLRLRKQRLLPRTGGQRRREPHSEKA